MSLRVKKIPATRGCIYDSEGVKLAWTERYYNLYFNAQNQTIKQKQNIFNKLKKTFPDISRNLILGSNNKILIKRHLTPTELKSALSLIDSTPSLNVELYLLRRNIDIPEVKKYVGNAVFVNGKWVGLSGIEKKYNSYLNGNDGLYTVMFDKKGKWIHGTSNTKKIMIPGNNFLLKENIDDIINNTKQHKY